MSDFLKQFLISQVLIWLPLGLGWWLRRSSGKKFRPPPELATWIFNFNLFLITPQIILFGIWKLDLGVAGWFWSPLIMGALLLVSSAGGAWFAWRRGGLAARTQGTLAMLFPMSNVGHTLAGFLTVLLLPDEAYAYHAIMIWPQTTMMFMVWLPTAFVWMHRIHAGEGRGRGDRLAKIYARVLVSPQSMGLVGMAAGTAVLLAGRPMPEWGMPWLKVLIFVSTVTIMFGMGLRLELDRVRRFLRLIRWVALAKFVLHPLFVGLLCWAVGLDGLIAGAVVILAFMPVGVTPVMFSNIADLDVDLANAGYLVTTLMFMILVLPVVILLLRLPFFTG